MELTSYRQEGTPWQEREGMVNTGTEDRTRAQTEAAAEDRALVRLKKLGVGEPKILLPGMVGGSLELGREGPSHMGPTPHGVSAASHLYGRHLCNFDHIYFP